MLFSPHGKGHPQRHQPGERRGSGAPIRRHPDLTAPYLRDDIRQGPAHDRECIALHTACAYHGVIGMPSDGHSAPAHEQRDASQVLRPCEGPVESPPDWTMGRQLDEGVQQDSVCHRPWLPALVVE